MGRYNFIFIFIFMTSLGRAQERIEDHPANHEYVIYSTVFKKGIYRTFDEFKFNNPSIVDEFNVSNKRVSILDIKTGKYKKIKNRNVWGFCDGEKIFVR